MLVTFEGLPGARFYQGVTFSPDVPVDVSEEWFSRCKNPRVVVVVAEEKPKRKRRTQAEMEEARANADTE
jgi:hypothetical protein